MFEVTLVIIIGVLFWVSHLSPAMLTNHIPHMLLPKHLADKFQNWVQRF